jgi:hypothetical protein
MSKRVVFKKRYVLGVGYPYALGLGPYTDFCLQECQTVGIRTRLNWPKELWQADLPRYRLVLERVPGHPPKGREA